MWKEQFLIFSKIYNETQSISYSEKRGKEREQGRKREQCSGKQHVDTGMDLIVNARLMSCVVCIELYLHCVYYSEEGYYP